MPSRLVSQKTLRSAKVTDDHSHCHRVAEHRSCAQVASCFLAVTEVYTQSFCILCGNNGEDFFLCDENEIDFVLWKPSQQLLYVSGIVLLL